MGPRTYLHRRRLHHNASKPTAITRILSNPSHHINHQLSSPLFSTLPAELRTLIFHYALLASPDPQKPYSRHSYWYRPGYTHARSIATNLLRTCKKIYLETYTLPLELNEHIVWAVEKSRIPPTAETTSYLLNDRLKTCQKNFITYVHLFCQQFWLEDWKDQWLAFSQAWPDGAASRIRITIRHTDWWYDLLGENSPLALDPKRKGRARVGEWVAAEEGFEKDSWGARFENLKGVRVLELELETVMSKRGELDANIAMAPTWRYKLGDGNLLVLDESATERGEWIGSRHFKGLGGKDTQAGLQLQLRQGSKASRASTSRTNSVAMEEEELAVEDRLEYYIVLLTWRARSAREVEQEDEEAAKAKERQEDEQGPSMNTSATIPAPVPPVLMTRPRTLYNRFNAPPTYYGPRFGNA